MHDAIEAAWNEADGGLRMATLHVLRCSRTYAAVSDDATAEHGKALADLCAAAVDYDSAEHAMARARDAYYAATGEPRPNASALAMASGAR